MKNILVRTLSGTIYVALIICSLLLHPAFFAVLSLAINFIAIGEFHAISTKFEVKHSKIWVYLNSFFYGLAILIILISLPGVYLAIPLVLLAISLILAPLFQNNGNAALSTAFPLFGTIYISLPLILLNLIQQLAIQNSIPYALAIFAIIWTNDTFAYLTGISIGRHKMFERVSPKKSWEGFLGGLIMGIVASLVYYYFYPANGMAYWIIFGFLTIISAVFGDFIESLLKRTANIKDSGSIMPGHGGLLDRIDSILFAAPILYIYLIVQIILQ